MVNGPLKIVWDNSAKAFLKQSIQFIKKDSPQSAEKVKDTVAREVNEIARHPYRHPADKYRLENKGNYRVLLVYNFRISYFIDTTEIRIVRVRRSKQSPTHY